MKKMRRLLILVFALLGACTTERTARVAEIDGSNDHRVFRLGAVSQLMLEPVRWQLEDAERRPAKDETPAMLLDRYLVQPYGLTETRYAKNADGGVSTNELVSSAADVLKVCYVILPHLERTGTLLTRAALGKGHVARYRADECAFVGFDTLEMRSAVILSETDDVDIEEGFDLLRCQPEE